MKNKHGGIKSKYEGWRLQLSGVWEKASIEDQSHVIRCPAYTDIRKGLNLDMNVVKHFRQVMLLRMKEKT